MRTVFAKSLYDQRRALTGWSLGIAALVLLEGALWPSIRDMPDLSEFLAGYPEPMRKLFNLEQFGTGTGFLNAELFSAMLPVLFLVYAIGRGAKAVAGEEERGTLDVLLVTPVTTGRLVLEQAAGLVVGLLALGAALFGSVLAASWLFALHVDALDLLAATLSVVLLGVEFGCLALALGAATGRRALALGVASTAAVAAYVLYAAGELVEAVRPWQPLSPFDQALADGPIGAGFRLAYLAMPVAAAVFLALALPIFARRDIAVAH